MWSYYKTNETLPINFHDILKNCLSFLHSENKWDDIFVDTTLHSILTNCKTISLKVFEKLHNERAIELYKFLLKYKDLFSVTELLLSKNLHLRLGYDFKNRFELRPAVRPLSILTSKL